MRALLLALLFVVSLGALAQDRTTHIPPRALEYLPTVTSQMRELWPDMFAPHYVPALIEHESCIALTHSRCWSPRSQLKTHREEGAGLGQLTRAYRSDGSIRFDALAEARKLDPAGLNELRWGTVYERPDLQIRVLVLMSRSTWNRLKPLVFEDWPRLAMTDAAYNGGLGGLLNERRACALKKGCDPQVWFGHVEGACTKSREPLYGNRSACDINRHHVHDVLNARMPKYKGRV